jgi:hypothetical protein
LTRRASAVASTSVQRQSVQRQAFSRQEVLFLVGVPLAWAVLLLFHPGGEGQEIYLDVRDSVTSALVVHIGMMLFIPLMAVVVLLLLRGVEGTAALTSRIALVPFVVFYSAWEALQGIGIGILVDKVNELPEAERAAGADLIQAFAEDVLIANPGVFGIIGSVGLITAAIAAGIALRRNAGAPLSVMILLGLSGFLIAAHPPPYGPIGLALFVVAVLLFVRSHSGSPAPAALGRPSPP